MRTALINSRYVPSPNPLIPLFAQARVRTRNGKLRKSDRGKMLGLARGFYCFLLRYISAAVSPWKFSEHGIVVRQSVRLFLSTSLSLTITHSILPENGNRTFKVKWKRGILLYLIGSWIYGQSHRTVLSQNVKEILKIIYILSLSYNLLTCSKLEIAGVYFNEKYDRNIEAYKITSWSACIKEKANVLSAQYNIKSVYFTLFIFYI